MDFMPEPGLDERLPLRRRPIIPALLGFASGIALDHYGVGTIRHLVVGALSVALMLGLVRRKPCVAPVGLLLAFLASLCLGWAYAYVRSPVSPRHLGSLRLEGREIYRVRGVVTEGARAFYTERPFAVGEHALRKWLVTIEVRQLVGDGGQTLETGGGLTVFVDSGTPELLPGDRVEFLARPKTNSPATNPGERDMSAVYERLGSCATASVSSPGAIEVISRPAWWSGPTVAVGRLRNYLGRRLDRVLLYRSRQDALPLIAALLFGRRDLLEPDLRETLQRSGTLHFLAISGLHVGIFAVCMGVMLTSLRLPVGPRIVLSIALVWAYVLFTGLQISSVRAGLMITFLLAAPLLGRRYEALSAVGAAAMVILVASPGQLFMPGFQLTFAAVWAIVCVYPQLSVIVWPWKDFLERAEQPEEMSLGRVLWLSVRSYLLLSVTVWVTTAPLLAWHFGYVSLIAPLLNMVVWPLVFTLLIACFALCVLLPLGPAMAGPVAAIAAGLAWLLCEAIRGASVLPGYGFAAPAISVLWVAAWYLAMVLWTLRTRLPHGRTVVIVAGGVLVVALVWQDVVARSRRGHEFVFADIGSGQAAVAFCPEGQTLLFDAGARSSSRSRVLVDILRARRVSKLDCVLLSHPDADHCNFAPEINERFDVAHFLMPKSGGLSAQGARVRGMLSALGASVQPMAQGARLAAGDLTCVVLHPDDAFLQRPTVSDNDQSIVASVEVDGCVVLFTGDIETMAMARLVSEQREALNADVLVMPHHGHYAAGLREFVAAVSPVVAVVSGRVDDCDPRSVAILRNSGVPLWITGQEGAIILRVSAGRVVFRGHSSGREEEYRVGAADVDGL